MFETPFSQAMLGMLIAVAAGAVIGLEREQSRGTRKNSFGGVRTFPVICVAGALAGLMAQALGAWIVVGSLLVLGGLLGVGHYNSVSTRESYGVTSELAAVVTFLLGVLATLPVANLAVKDRLLLVPAIAGGLMALLSVKEPLHDAVRKLSLDDIYAAAKFVLLALIVLPLLPDEGFGPFHVLNPFKLGVMVALIAGIGFVGYLATRFIDTDRALLITGIFGGVASSTALTVTLSRRVRDNGKASIPVLAAVIAAGGVMFIRVLVVVAVMDVTLVPALAPPFLTMALVSGVIAFAIYRSSSRTAADGGQLSLQNPFELGAAFKVAAVLAVVVLVTRWAEHAFGASGLYGTAALSGIADVDGIVLSATSMHRDGTDAPVAAAAITIAAMVNTLSKVTLATWLGGRTLGRRFLLASIAVIAAGVVALIIA